MIQREGFPASVGSVERFRAECGAEVLLGARIGPGQRRVVRAAERVPRLRRFAEPSRPRKGKGLRHLGAGVVIGAKAPAPVPDLAAAARLFDLEGAPEAQVRQVLGAGFPKHPLRLHASAHW